MKTNWRTVFLVARQELMTYLRRRSFIILTLGFPCIALLMTFFSSYSSVSPPIEAVPSINNMEQAFEIHSSKIGLVDELGIIEVTPPSLEGVFLPYESLHEAEHALSTGEIELFFHIPATYSRDGSIERVTQRSLAEADFALQDTFAMEWLLRENLLAELDPTLRQRIEEPVSPDLVEVEYLFPLSEEQASENSPQSSFALAYLAAMLLYSTIFMSAAFLLRSITTERENHIMEVLLTSLQPIDLLAGKMIGLGLLGLGQTIIWGISAYLVAWLRFSTLPFSQFQVSWFLGAMLVLYFLLGYALFSTMMASLGALLPSTKASGPATMLVILPAIVPLMLLGPLTEQPHSLLAIILSLIPFTAPLTMIVRLTQVEVPVWQLISSVLLMLITIPILLRLVARLFRAQILLDSTDFSLRRLFNLLRKKQHHA